ncbi:MAG: MoaD/ThiS family protein [Halobacteria archaeon]
MGIALHLRLFPGGERSIEVEPGTTYGALLVHLGLNPETVVVLRHGLPVPDDEPAASGEIRIVRVVSGG